MHQIQNEFDNYETEKDEVYTNMKTFQEFLDFHKDISFDGWKEFPFDDYKCLSGEFSGEKTIVKYNKKGINRENPLPVFITPVPKIYRHLGFKKKDWVIKNRF